MKINLAPHVHVYNPLPLAYAHRERQIHDVFDGRVEFIRSTNEEKKGFSKFLALLIHIKYSRKILRTESPVLVTWPLLGWWEILLLSTKNNKAYLSIHDPRPLRKQFGLGLFAARVANLVPKSRRPKLICHSSVAADSVKSIFPGTYPTILPLPMVNPKPIPDKRITEEGKLSVIVLGQYKPSRDIELLERLSVKLRQLSFKARIVGRGWPDVSGWDVENRFVSEEEFDNYLLESGCLLIPYKEYFQSGVALRAVELGVPVVGLEHPFLCESLGLKNSPGLVPRDSHDNIWINAIENATSSNYEPELQFTKIKNQWINWAMNA